MSEVEVQASATPVGKGKKGEKKTSKHAKPTHPPTSDMVNMAIKGLKERSGSSLQAIKNTSPRIIRWIRRKWPHQGQRASGSFKLAAGGGSTQENRRRRNPRKRRPPWPRQETSRKEEGRRQGRVFGKVEDRAATAVKAKKPAGEKKAKAPKSPSKAKKTAKSTTKKPKAPEPKTVKTAAASSKAKKVASPKKKK
ncbi:hypothetical protein HHI36_023875 [Cryptolaemus montrouzieri]|uniref:H15 domain-containing protein n=1 Tax=Cryptolaemus montrouzieri TaxID=559131 RepID=A0ABD2PHS4_9CUCU